MREVDSDTVHRSAAAVTPLPPGLYPVSGLTGLRWTIGVTRPTVPADTSVCVALLTGGDGRRWADAASAVLTGGDEPAVQTNRQLGDW